MAKGQYLSSHQKAIVGRYYTHKETVVLTKLQEAVTELFLAQANPADAKAAVRKWKWVGEALVELGVEPVKARQVVESQNAEALATLVGTLAAKKP